MNEPENALSSAELALSGQEKSLGSKHQSTIRSARVVAAALEAIGHKERWRR